MNAPCEIIVSKILPTIRSELTRELVRTHNLSQRQVAKKLGITESAVSQYLSKKRGHNIVFDEKTTKMIKDLASKKAKQKSDKIATMEEICILCSAMRKSKQVCKIHREIENMPDHCKMCLEG